MLDTLWPYAVILVNLEGDVVSRHNQLTDTFVQTSRFAGASASIDTGSG